MSNLSTLITEAHAATTALFVGKAESKEREQALFTTSAIKTYAVVKATKGKTGEGAKALANENKKAGVGYGSATAVGYHARTGRILAMPAGDWEAASADLGGEQPPAFPTATGIQSLVKAVGPEQADAIISGSRTQAKAVAALMAAKEGPTLEDILKTAAAAMKKAGTKHDPNVALTDKALASVLAIVGVVNTLVQPDQAVIVPSTAAALTDPVMAGDALNARTVSVG